MESNQAQTVMSRPLDLRAKGPQCRLFRLSRLVFMVSTSAEVSRYSGATRGSRTLVTSLEDWRTTVVRLRHIYREWPAPGIVSFHCQPRVLWSNNTADPRMCRPMLECGIFSLDRTRTGDIRLSDRLLYLLSYKDRYTRCSRVCARFQGLCSPALAATQIHKMQDAERERSLSFLKFILPFRAGRPSWNRTKICTSRAKLLFCVYILGMNKFIP